MRTLSLVAAAAALSFASLTSAAPVSIAPVSISPELQTDLTDDFGAREGAYLQDMVTSVVASALERQGAQVGAGAPLTVEITIVEADPNKPTMQQMVNRPGLDYIGSIAVGGGEYSAVLRRADGSVVDEVTHRRYAFSLADVNPAGGSWSEARRAARGFATKVADAYAAHALQSAAR